MSAAAIQASGDGRVDLSGKLDFTSVPEIWLSLKGHIEQESRLKISLKAVSAANSAALAMLIAARELGAQHGHEVLFEDIPSGLADLAALSNASELLG